jgi:hypothetical protein
MAIVVVSVGVASQAVAARTDSSRRNRRVAAVPATRPRRFLMPCGERARALAQRGSLLLLYEPTIVDSWCQFEAP